MRKWRYVLLDKSRDLCSHCTWHSPRCPNTWVAWKLWTFCCYVFAQAPASWTKLCDCHFLPELTCCIWNFDSFAMAPLLSGITNALLEPFPTLPPVARRPWEVGAACLLFWFALLGSFIRLFVCLYVCMFVCLLVGCLVGWLVGWLVVWLVGWLVGWLISWLVS